MTDTKVRTTATVTMINDIVKLSLPQYTTQQVNDNLQQSEVTQYLPDVQETIFFVVNNLLYNM